ncbi:prefoldin subunit beta [Candidatus Woesearchaeota archaeon CG1_02_57_44]|nr:MAG: prefoldin subunit beta [Candidatus Woesearchaeota archaeon CG1_02_57_44]
MADVEQLQAIEQNLQNLRSQRQQVQMQLMETDSALEELDKSGKAYRIVGGIMVAVDKDSLRAELEKKKELLQVRSKTIEKQEGLLKERGKSLQAEFLKGMKKE